MATFDVLMFLLSLLPLLLFLGLIVAAPFLGADSRGLHDPRSLEAAQRDRSLPF